MSNVLVTPPVQGAWTTFNTTLSQPGSVAFTQTRSSYCVIGKTCIYSYYLSVTGTGTTNNNITIALPLTAASSNVFSGFGGWYNAGATLTHAGGHTTASTTTISLIKEASFPGSYFGKDPLAALGNGDVIAGTVVYEIA
jgi:hypothetical protein